MMEVSVELLDKSGRSATCSGVLPAVALETFSEALVLLDDSSFNGFPHSLNTAPSEISDDVDSRSLFLAQKLFQLNSVNEYRRARRIKPGIALPVAIALRHYEGRYVLLFLPPFCWEWGLACLADREVKKMLGCCYDVTLEIRAQSDCCLQASQEEDQKVGTVKQLTDTYDPYFWLRIQSRQDAECDDGRAETFKGISLGNGAVGHRLLCERLEKQGYMFFYEANLCLPGDVKRNRRVDIVVFRNQTAIIVEIDGGQHGEYRHRQDDYDRDRLINRHWSKMCRFSNKNIVDDIDSVMAQIDQMLSPQAHTSC